MIELTDKNVSGKVLDHLGLVASTIYDIGLVQKIDGSLIVCVVFIFLPHSCRSKSCNPRSPKIFFERGVLN